MVWQCRVSQGLRRFETITANHCMMSLFQAAGVMAAKTFHFHKKKNEK